MTDDDMKLVEDGGATDSEHGNTRTTTYRVTYRGQKQIKQWLLAQCGHDAGDHGDLTRAVYYYAEAAAHAKDGQITLPATATMSGRHARLRPERVRVITEDSSVVL